MRWTRLAPAAALVIAAVIGLGLAATAPLDRDESMYQAAAAALGSARLYEDVPFFQPPYAAWIHGVWHHVVPGDWVLGSARLLDALVGVALACLLLRLWRRLGAPPLVAALLLLLLWHDAVLRLVLGAARNYDLAQLAIVVALLGLPWRLEDPAAGRARLTASGILAGIAVGLKLTYVPLALVAVGWPLLLPGRRRAVAWTALGAGLGLAPAMAAFATVDLAKVRFQLLDYHLLNAQWHAREGLGRGLDLAGKLDDARRLYRETGHAAVLSLGVVSAALVFARGDRQVLLRRPPWLLACLLVAAGVVMLAVPRPLQLAYYAPLLIGLASLAAAACGQLAGRARAALVAVVLVAALVGIGHRSAANLALARQVARPQDWTAVAVHRTGQRIARLTEQAAGRKASRPIATAHPIYALEAGRPLLAGLAPGEFGWRLGDLLGADRARQQGLIIPALLDSALRAAQPAAIVVREDGPWDAPLVDWARQAGWHPIPLAQPASVPAGQVARPRGGAAGAAAEAAGRVIVWLPGPGTARGP